MPYLGKIILSGIVSEPVQADLVQLHVKPAANSVIIDDNCSERTDNIAPYMSVIFAVCDKMSGNYDLILTADVIEQLNHLNSYAINTITADGGNTTQSAATVTDDLVSSPTVLAHGTDDTTVTADRDVTTTAADVSVDNNNY